MISRANHEAKVGKNWSFRVKKHLPSIVSHVGQPRLKLTEGRDLMFKSQLSYPIGLL